MYKHLRKFRALIVDDSLDFRILAIRALEKLNVLCTEAADGIAAEEALKKTPFDLMLCDLRMPRKHGHQLIVEVLNSECPPLIAAITGVTDPRITSDLIMRGVVDVLQKPVDFDFMAAKLRALVERNELVGRTASSGQAAQVARQLTDATASLKEQLSEITKSFEDTISGLEKQKADLEVGFLGSIRVFTSLIERLKQSHGSHAGRVAEMAVWMGKKMDLKQSQIRDIEFASLLHEIGQFGMPDSIRAKPPWALTEDEARVFRQYPVIGAALLSEVQGMSEIVDIIESHAENFGGDGFPSGKREKAIPIGARIVRIADGCDTLLMHAKPDNPSEAIREHLLAHKGKHYDPDVVVYANAFVQDQKVEHAVVKTSLLEINDIRSGMVLADDVYDENGHFLMRGGAVVSPSVIRHLHHLLGSQKVAVIDPENTGPSTSEA
ncbi:MAG: hypothetical protein AMXMBFR84_12210 [Candidatus Hydrogenedentota bacterium]